MPCLAIHLAVAKEYLKRHPEKYVSEQDCEDFLLGSIAPDVGAENINELVNGLEETTKETDSGAIGLRKNNRHFGLNFQTDDMIEYMKKKVDFHNFFRWNPNIDTPFLEAYFLHLLCDYYFFGEYITSDKIQNLPFEQVAKMGYNDYDLITPILIEKYHLAIPSQIKDIMSRKGEGNLQIIDESTVDLFIDEMSRLDLKEEQKKVLGKSY